MTAVPQFFIFSTGSAGSTLLQAVLDAHPNIRIPIEGRIYIHLRVKYGKWHPQMWSTLISDAHTEPKIRHFWNLDRTALLEISPLPSSFQQAVQRLAQFSFSPFDHNKIELIGDKNPVNVYFIRELMALYPNAKFIHLIRNCDDFIRSARKINLGQSKSLLAVRWLEENRMIRSYVRQFPSQSITIRYEDLITEPESQLKKICQFLNVYYDSSMLQFYKKVQVHYDQIMGKLGDHHPYHKEVSNHLARLTQPIQPTRKISAQSKDYKLFTQIYQASALGRSQKYRIYMYTFTYIRFYFYYAKVQIFFNFLGFKFRAKFWKIKPY